MPLDPKFTSRMERRLPIMVVVRLTPCPPAGTDGEERTYTDNISRCGARIFSKHAWQPGDAVRVTPLNEDSVCGRVIYCHRLPDNRYGVGVKFQGSPVTWSIIQRYSHT
jgi:PilZ domain-containing protein